MARNKEFDDALDELKMLHDTKNHDYATAENPYKNLEGVQRIGIEPWRGIVIRLMDKFERVEQFCRSEELAIKSEGLEDTFKDIAIYSTLAMILYRKDEDDDFMREWKKRPKSTKQVDKILEWKEIERKAVQEGICKICPNCDQENKNRIEPFSENECHECGYKYFHAEALAHQQEFEERSNVKIVQDKLEAQRQEHLRRARDN